MVQLHLSASSRMIIHFITYHLVTFNIAGLHRVPPLKSVSASLATAYKKKPNVKLSHEENFNCPTSDWRFWLYKECAGDCTLPPQLPLSARSPFASLKPLNNIYTYLQSDARRVGFQYVQVQTASKNTQNEYENGSQFMRICAEVMLTEVTVQQRKTARERMMFHRQGLCECNMCVRVCVCVCNRGHAVILFQLHAWFIY